MIDQAITVFNRENVELVVHAGDFISPFSADRFKGLHCPLTGVFGNNDGDHRNLTKKFDSFRAEVSEFFSIVTIGEKSIAVIHGDRKELLKTIIQSDFFDLVIYGHTHAFEVKKTRNLIIVNPGECCGYLSGNSTIAIFDTESCKTRRVDLRETETEFSKG
jgi:putative phosphoesterase